VEAAKVSNELHGHGHGCEDEAEHRRNSEVFEDKYKDVYRLVSTTQSYNIEHHPKYKDLQLALLDQRQGKELSIKLLNLNI